MNWLAATGVAVVATYLSAAIGGRLGVKSALKDADMTEEELHARLTNLAAVADGNVSAFTSGLAEGFASINKGSIKIPNNKNLEKEVSS